MSDRSDGLVLFGATGDLARKKLYPALHQLAGTDALPDSVVGIAISDWSDDELVEHARASIEEFGGGIDPAAFERLAGALSYVAGDYRAADTYDRLATALGSCERPLLYLAIPPLNFLIIESLQKFHDELRQDAKRGRGIGASHQTGWTALVAELIHSFPRQESPPRQPGGGEE